MDIFQIAATGAGEGDLAGVGFGEAEGFLEEGAGFGFGEEGHGDFGFRDF